jgi:hypothetical protein
VRKRPEREVWLSSSTRPVSDLPPVTFHPNGSPNGSVNGSANGSGPGRAADPRASGDADEEPAVLPPVDEGRLE